MHCNMIDGTEKSASCHECDGASDARLMHRSWFCNSSKLHGRWST